MTITISFVLNIPRLLFGCVSFARYYLFELTFKYKKSPAVSDFFLIVISSFNLKQDGGTTNDVANRTTRAQVESSIENAKPSEETVNGEMSSNSHGTVQVKRIYLNSIF